MHRDDNAPATKGDLQKLEVKLRTEIMHGVKLLNEQLVIDFRDAFNDRTEQLHDTVKQHDRRIRRLEQRTFGARMST